VLVALAVSAVLAIPGPAGALVAGVGDQQPFVFADRRFQALEIHHARLSVGWNVLSNRAQTRRLNVWLRAARADGVAPLISFGESQTYEQSRRLPTVAQFAAQFRRVHARYPWITDFATWNEANYCGQPTCHHPALVAAYYRQLRRLCPSCNVLAAELLDVPGMVSWVRRFQRALHGYPAIWGLHDYIGANRLQTASTQALLNATPSLIWLTEVGGVVSRHNHSSHAFRESPAHAATVTRFIFERLARLSPRIARVYVYQWNAGTHRPAAWDSGLVGPHGRLRPAYVVLVAELRRWGLLPAATGSGPGSPMAAA